MTLLAWSLLIDHVYWDHVKLIVQSSHIALRSVIVQITEWLPNITELLDWARTALTTSHSHWVFQLMQDNSIFIQQTNCQDLITRNILGTMPTCDPSSLTIKPKVLSRPRIDCNFWTPLEWKWMIPVNWASWRTFNDSIVCQWSQDSGTMLQLLKVIDDIWNAVSQEQWKCCRSNGQPTWHSLNSCLWIDKVEVTGYFCLATRASQQPFLKMVPASTYDHILFFPQITMLGQSVRLAVSSTERKSITACL